MLFVSGFLPADQRNKADMLTANKCRPRVQSVGSKTNDNHAHRRGNYL